MTIARLPVAEFDQGQRILDRFVIRREIGRGGCSVVYSAWDQTVDREVALKLLVPPPASAVEARERLRREVQLVRSLRHQNIVGVHEFVEDGPLSFIVMDLVDGQDLAATVARTGPLSPDRALAVATDVAAALVAAHQAGILHRDIKPANILLERGGRALLTDFGSARLDSQATMTRTGGLVGTVAYLAPEAWQGQRVDARTDLYALGVTLYEALTGVLPPRTSPHQPPEPDPNGFRPSRVRPDLPAWLDQIVAVATMADRRHRFATAERLVAAMADGTFPEQPMVTAVLTVVAAPAAAPSPVPRGFWLLLGAVVMAGGTAAALASPHFLWSTPVISWILWRNVRRPVPPSGAAPLPQWTLAGDAANRYRRLPEGQARTLLDDVLLLAQAQVAAAASGREASRRRARLEPLVATAIDAALDLAEVDDVLGRMEETARRIRHVPAAFWGGIADLEKSRDGLSTILLEVLAALGRARSAATEDFDSARVRLEELAADLKGDVAAMLAAGRDIDTLLR